MGKLKRPVVLYERIVTLNKRLAVPDARFKSGYRTNEVIATSSLFLNDKDHLLTGGAVSLDHIHIANKKATKTHAHIEADIPLKGVMEQEV